MSELFIESKDCINAIDGISSSYNGINVPFDCGTDRTIDISICEENKKWYIDRYIKEGNSFRHLTKKNINNYIGKTVQMFSLSTCRGICIDGWWHTHCVKCGAVAEYYQYDDKNIYSPPDKLYHDDKIYDIHVVEIHEDPYYFDELRLCSFTSISGEEITITMYGREYDRVPHMHFKSDSLDGCIKLCSPEYYIHENHTSTLSDEDVILLYNKLQEPTEYLEISNYRFAIHEWNSCGNNDTDIDYNTSIPDYTKLNEKEL